MPEPDHRTRSFARELGLEPLTTPIRDTEHHVAAGTRLNDSGPSFLLSQYA